MGELIYFSLFEDENDDSPQWFAILIPTLTLGGGSASVFLSVFVQSCVNFAVPEPYDGFFHLISLSPLSLLSLALSAPLPHLSLSPSPLSLSPLLSLSLSLSPPLSLLLLSFSLSLPLPLSL